MIIKAKIPQLENIKADVWIDESHKREMEIVSNPIEFGSPTTDHAFVKAMSLSINLGVTNTPFGSLASDRIEEIRDQLYALQDEKKFLTVQTITGGIYKNMLLSSIGWSTDTKSVHAVIFRLELEEVIITKTSLTNYTPLPVEEKIKKQIDPTKKRGELPKNALPDSEKGNRKSRDKERPTNSSRSRSEATESRANAKDRINTADASTNSQQKAKSIAATQQKNKIREADNRTYLKRVVDSL